MGFIGLLVLWCGSAVRRGKLGVLDGSVPEEPRRSRTEAAPGEKKVLLSQRETTSRFSVTHLLKAHIRHSGAQ